MKKILLILLLSVFSLSCALDVNDKSLSSSLSFTLPSDNITRSEDNETSYNVILMFGESKKDGKAFENNYKGGDRVFIKGLKPGLYTLIIKGENNTHILEGEKSLRINSGENKTSIQLSKKAKASVVLDLSKITLPQSSTFNVEVKDINDKVIVDKKNLSYTKSYTIPYNFNEGSYFISFSTNNNDSKKYYLENASPLIVTNDKIKEVPFSYVISVTSRPIKEFFVNTSALDKGDGSEALPFNSLSKALDVILSSSDIKKDDIRINVKGEVIEPSPILIDNNANITIIGEGSDVTTIVTYFDVLDSTLTLSNMTLMPDRQTGKKNTVILDNSTLVIDNDLVTRDIEMKNGSLIRLNKALPVDTFINLHLDNYEENRKVLEKTNPSLNFNGILLEDLYYEINSEGLIKKTKEKVTLTFNKEVVNKNYEVKYTDERGESTPLPITTKEVVMEDFFDIGNEYTFTLYTNTPTSGLQKVEEKRITISKNFNENNIVFLEVSDLYVDFDLGSDTAYNGEEKKTPYKTLDKAIQRVKTSLSVNPIKINLTGFTLSDSAVDIENIESLVLKTEDALVQQNKKAYINPINITSSNVKIVDVNTKKITLNNSHLTLQNNPSSRESLYINEIYLKDDNSIITVEGELPPLSNKIVIDLSPSLYVEGNRIIDTSVSNNLTNFTLKNEQYKIGLNGEVTVNSNVNLIFDTNIEQNRYECNIYDKDSSSLLKTIPLSESTTSLPFYFNEGIGYELKIIDNSDYQKVKAIRNITGSKEKKDVNINLNRTLYVSNNGQDTNSGENKENSLLTLNKAVSEISKKANGDLDNEYCIILVGEKGIGPLSTPLTNGTNIEINDAIKLTIKGEEEEDPRVTSLRCVLESDTTTPLILINNENAIVQIDNLALKIKGSGSSNESESLIDVQKGHLKVLSNVSFEREGLIDKTLLKIGSNGFVTLSNAQRLKEDTFLNKIYVENRSVNAPFIFLEEGFGDKGSDIYNPIKYTPYDVILSSIYSQSLYPKVVKNVNDRPLSEEKTLIFNVNNDLYINESGELTNKIAFKYNLTNVPGTADTTVSSRNYSLYIYDEKEEQIHETKKISKALNNETVLKVVPSQTLHIVIKDNEVMDKNNAPLIISDNKVKAINGVTDIPLFEIAIKNTSAKNNIKEALTSLSKVNEGASPITDPINITLKLNDESYIEGEWSFNTTEGSINVPANISFNIKKDEKAAKAKIAIDSESANPNILILEAKPTTLCLSFEGIDFESKGIDDNSQGSKQIGYALNLDGGGTFSFKDVSFTPLGPTAFIKVRLFFGSQNKLSATNVELGGKIDLKNGSFIYLARESDKSNPFGGGYVCPTLVISSPITTPSPIPLTMRDLSGALCEDSSKTILKIKDGSGVSLSDEIKNFTLKDNGGTITAEGLWQL